jgi:hypothetical protein
MPQASPGSGSAGRSPRYPGRSPNHTTCLSSPAPCCCRRAPTPGHSAGSRCRRDAPCRTRGSGTCGGTSGWPRGDWPHGGIRGGAPPSACAARRLRSALLARRRLQLARRRQPGRAMTASSSSWLFAPRPARQSPGRRPGPSRSRDGSWVFDLSWQPKPKRPHRMVEHWRGVVSLTADPRFRSSPAELSSVRWNSAPLPRVRCARDSDGID